MKLKAQWNESTERYEIDSVDVDGGLGGPKQIHSCNGNDWEDECGQPADSETFRASEILLIGGPRNGAAVG
jgi:hypothetical protein